MKVKNIMFSGFAAAILMGVAAEASAAPVAVASKGYVDSVAGQLSALTTDDNGNLVEAINELKEDKLEKIQGMTSELSAGQYYSSIGQSSTGQITVDTTSFADQLSDGNMIAPTTNAVFDALAGKQAAFTDGTGASTETGFISSVGQSGGAVTASATPFDTEFTDETKNHEHTAPTTKAVYDAIQGVNTTVTNLNLDQVGADGSYVKLVSQTNGEVEATAQGFDQTVGAGATNNNAPTTLAVYNAIQGTHDALDLGETGGDGKYVKVVSQVDGRVSATAESFDTVVNSTTAASTKAPTTKAVYDAISAIPVMPEACSGTDVVCVLTSVGGDYQWAVMTKPALDTDAAMTGTAAQAQTITTPTVTQ